MYPKVKTTIANKKHQRISVFIQAIQERYKSSSNK